MMAIMASFRQNRQLYDPIRRTWVANSPEEQVRQQWLKVLIEQLEFPRELIAVEKELKELPHLSREPSLPQRRADLICFAKGIHPKHDLFPLLLIEFKRDVWDRAAMEQLLGYNHYVKAPYAALANPNTAHLVFPEKCPFLPSFLQLVSRVKNGV